MNGMFWIIFSLVSSTVVFFLSLSILFLRRKLLDNAWFFSEVAGLVGLREKEKTKPIVILEALKDMKENLENRLKNMVLSERKCFDILNCLDDIVVILGENKKIIFVNDVAKRFFGEERIVGKRISEVCESYELLNLLEKSSDKDELKGEIAFYYPSKKFYMVTLKRISNGSMLLMIMKNITREKMLDKMKKEFITNISHELKTPLTSIHGYAETLLDGGLEDVENARKFLNTILEESSRLSRLINNLLDLEEMEHGEVGMDMEEIDLSRVIDRVRNIIKPLAESLNVDVIYDVRSVKIMGDYDRLIQALLNIIDNAVKYTSQKVGGEKKVFVNLQEDEKNAIIEVRDTGPGIPSDAIPRLFERFYRVDKARSRKLGGTGLGLSIAKFIVEKHGGRIEVQSKRGEGSTFRIILPKVVMENESV